MMTAAVHEPTAPHYATFEVDRETRLVDGSVVAHGEIEVVHELGRGGMSVVYRAIDLRNGRKEIALKVANACSSHIITARFHNEARLGQKLGGHSNVVMASRAGQLDDPEEFEGRAYLVMDAIEGTSLAGVMADHRIGLSWQRACMIARDVAFAMEAVHSWGIVHRDIKPANVLLAVDKSMLIDFGLAYSTGDSWTERSPDLTHEGSVPGTLLYMSPEQIGHAKPAPSMDTYSFGVMLYELFTGNPPYHRLSQAEMIARKCDPNQTPYPLSKICPELDERLATLVHRCLRHTPSHRPTATELREVLEAVLGPRLVAEVPPNASSPFRKLLALLAILVLGVLGLVFWLWPGDSETSATTATTYDDPLVVMHRATRLAESHVVRAPTIERPQQPAVTVGKPMMEVKDEVPHTAPAAMKNSPAKLAAKKRSGDSCTERIQAARRAKSQSSWGKVLYLTKQEQCWRGASKVERQKLRTQALFETGRYTDCAAAGRGLTDPDAVRWVSICKSKSGSETTK